MYRIALAAPLPQGVGPRASAPPRVRAPCAAPAGASAVPLAVPLAAGAGGGLGFLVALSRAYARRGSARRAITSALSRLGGAVGATFFCFFSSASSHFSYSYSCAPALPGHRQRRCCRPHEFEMVPRSGLSARP